MSIPNEPNRLQSPPNVGPVPAKSFGSAANWFVVIAAVLLVFASLGGYFYHREQLAAIAAEHLRLVVMGPASLTKGASADYAVSTTSISGQPLIAQIEVAMFDANSKRLNAYKEPADERGRLKVSISPDMNLPPKFFLEVVARHGENREEVRIPLRIEERRGGQPALISGHSPKEREELSVTFRPEGGRLVSGLENRVYFIARDRNGKPIDLTGVVVSKARDGREADVAAVQTICDGMGAFSLIPGPGETYSLKISAPKDAKTEPKLPDVSAERGIVLTTGAGVFDAGKPLDFNVRAAKPDMPLVAVAYSVGVQAGQQSLVTRAGANSVSIAVDDALSGPIRLAVFNYSTSPPKLIAERLVYRRPSKKADGDKTEMSRLADELQDAGDIENLDFYLGDKIRGKTPASTALDLLLGSCGRPGGECRAPAVFDNLSNIRAGYEKTLIDYQADRTRTLSTLTTAGFFGGLGLVLLVAMLGVMRIVSGVHLWIAAVGAAACCLIIGSILTDPGRLAAENKPAVGFSNYSENER